MAGSKAVPLTWGIGGKVIGSATLDENDLIMAEIEIEDDDIQKIFAQDLSLSVYPVGTYPIPKGVIDG